MRLAEIWRYPVKSMAGERLDGADLRPDGIEGDRVVQAWDARGRLVTARNHPGLLGHRATIGADGGVLVDGLPWTDPEVTRRVEAAAGVGVRLRWFEGAERFDVLPLLVATDGALAAFGRDSRRLRPNLVIEGVEGLAERGWEGRAIRVGRAVVGLADLRGRCVMTTWDPDTQAQDVGVLRDIARRFDGRLCLNAAVLEPARIAVGDAVELLGATGA
ncbi:MAG TPA: MOSC N-terminal beta barrel domain-containing protein [Vicinamibacteria bacterium]